MSDQRQTTMRVLQLVSHLGGPACTPEELRWAMDIPAGQQLLRWLADQVPEQASNSTDAALRGTGEWLETAVSPIVLYPEERNALTAAVLSDSGVEGSRSQAATSYELPSQLRSRASTLEADAEILDRHAARLKHRLSASKQAAKGMKQTIHHLQKQVQDAYAAIQEQQVRLADLSAESDGTVARVTSLALQALQNAEGEGGIDALKAEISGLSGSRGTVAATTKQLYQTLDEGYASLPRASELQQDGEAVQSKLQTLTKNRNVTRKIVDSAYVEELEKMAERIEMTQDAEVIARILEANSVNPGGDLPDLDVDCKGELEHAGQLDRLALLRVQEEGLDTITSYMRDELIPRLQQTYDSLHAKRTLAIETEAVVSALIEELEDVNDAVESTRQLAATQPSETEIAEEDLEAQVVALLKDLLLSETETPTVLLNRSDVESELASLDVRAAAARKAEENWATGLRSRLAELSSSTAPLLAAAYANSPVNTSPPFAPSAEQVSLQEETHSKAHELMSAAARLQKETELSSRDKRKLSSFIEKWVAG
ncbi:hypothetical protein OH76DRAFT_1350927 [Lentinus brumalis]|uniref:Uncharacterized protein n=1 Tax=Lentinus brumalis TaxID=2498619 RepID=A0A371D9Y8_9APHY|nr:hypothetical protein OH76DRAFT_1350927 [Polyporus brumalis]